MLDIISFASDGCHFGGASAPEGKPNFGSSEGGVPLPVFGAKAKRSAFASAIRKMAVLSVIELTATSTG